MKGLVSIFDIRHHSGFREGLMTIIPLGCGKGEYYIVE